MTDHAAPDAQAVAQTVAAARSAAVEEHLGAHNGQLTTENGPLDPSHLVGTELEVDDNTDSGLDDDDSSISTSIAPSVIEGKWEMGRRYHGFESANYFLPNDEEEIDRLELQHQIWYIILNGGLYLSPLEKERLKNALDIGCGTGCWAIDFADAHPGCEVLGTDLSPIQPSKVPPNCSFMIDDAGKDWAYDRKFDYIHTRAISSGIRDWDRFIEQAFENLNPGGWIELQELHFPLQCDDGTATQDRPIMKWGQGVFNATKKCGIDLLSAFGHMERLRKTGFVKMEESHIKWPIGPWPKGRKEKRIGALLARDLGGGLRGVSQKMFMQILGMPQDEFDIFIAQVHDDILNPKIHAYIPMDIFWAQKPFEGTANVE